jgi:hypothetical protein
MKSALIAVLAVAVLAGCGSSDAVSPDPVAEAAEKTAATPTSYTSLRSTMTVPGVAKPVTMTGEGAFDNERKVGWMTIDMSSFAKSIPEGEGVPTDPELWKTRQVMDFSDGLVLYMQFPFLTEMMRTDKPWIRIDVAKAGRELGIDIGQLMQVGQDPVQQLGQLRTITDDLEEVGPETVRDLATTHYRGTVDLREYDELFPENERPKIRKSIESMIELMGKPTYPVDVWIDQEQLVRRMSFEFTQQTPEGDMPMAMTMEFFDFGRPVEVKLPAASDTIDITELDSALQ